MTGKPYTQTDRQTRRRPRNSSLELLRIVAILIIIVHHFGVHGVFHAADSSANILTLSTFSWQLFFTQLVSWGGPMGNAIFILITGYFMVNRSLHWQKLILLLAAMLFYSWVIEAIVYGGQLLPYTLKSLVRETLPMLFGANWFVSCYLIFSLFIPFINRFLLSIDKREYEKFLLMMFLALIVLPAGKMVTFFTNAPILFFGFVYACGGYLRLHGAKWTAPGMHRRHLRNFMILLVIVLASIVALDAVGLFLHKESLLKVGNPVIKVLEVPLAISLFLYFLTRPYFYSAWINRVAGTVLGIYLIHDNDLMRKLIWDYIVPNLDFIHSSWYVLFYVGKVLAVFFVCVLIEMARKAWLEPVVSRWLQKKSRI